MIVSNALKIYLNRVERLARLFNSSSNISSYAIEIDDSRCYPQGKFFN